MLSHTLTKKRLGEILLQRRMITEQQLQQALDVHREKEIYVGEALIDLGILKEVDIVVALVVQCGLPYIAVNKYNIDSEVLELIPEEYVRRHRIIPLDCIGNVLSVVMPNPLERNMCEELERITGHKIAIFISTASEIDQAINRLYSKRDV